MEHMVFDALDHLGLKYKTRNFFGNISISVNDNIIAILSENQLFVKFSSSYKLLFEFLDYRMLILEKDSIKNGSLSRRPNNKYRLNYYHVDAISINHINKHLNFCMKTNLGKSDQIDKPRLREAPNLTVRHERLLSKVGIFDMSDLKEIGSVEAYRRVRASLDGMLHRVTVLYFEGAIKGVHYATLSIELRNKLFSQII